jgi:hypothetical protein
MPVSPLRFDLSFEKPEEDEAETTREIVKAMRSILEITQRDYGHAVRSVHAKSHGLLQGEMRVLNALPPELVQGVFAKARTYPVVLRFSTIPGDILDDDISVPRGLAIKIIGVEGERLPGAEDAVTQDFLMLNAPTFAASTPKVFLRTLRLLARTTDRLQTFKKVLSFVLRPTTRLVEAVGTQSVTLHRGNRDSHIDPATSSNAIMQRAQPLLRREQ